MYRESGTIDWRMADVVSIQWCIRWYQSIDVPQQGRYLKLAH